MKWKMTKYIFVACWMTFLQAMPCIAGSMKDTNSSKPFFIKQGDTYTVTSRAALDLHEELPLATYSVGFNAASGQYYLQTIDDFEITGKIYGDTVQQADRILRTFLDRDEGSSTGVLLAGEKGSGKTFLAKYIAVQAAARNKIPTMVINQPLVGERFNAFMQSIQQPMVVLLDEFEKVYSDKNKQSDLMLAQMHGYGEDDRRTEIPNYTQDSLLTLLDGVYPSKMLFVLTTNDKFRVSSNMRNRPGRIYYVIDFDGLTPDFVREYCEDELRDKSLIPQLVAVSGLFEAFNFDMLQAVVEEMNRYGETPEEVLKFLNVRPEFGTGSGSRYTIEKLVVDGNEIPKRKLQSYTGSSWQGNPLLGVVNVAYPNQRRASNHRDGLTREALIEAMGFEGGDVPPPEELEEKLRVLMTDGDDESDYDDYSRREQIQFTVHHIDGIDSVTGTYWYWHEEKQARLVLRKQSVTSMKPGDLDFEKLSKLGKPEESLKT